MAWNSVSIARLAADGALPGGWGGLALPDPAGGTPGAGAVASTFAGGGDAAGAAVVAVGAGKALDNGSTRAPAVKVGDKVLFGKYAGTEVKLDGTEYLVVREDDIFAILG